MRETVTLGCVGLHGTRPEFPCAKINLLFFMPPCWSSMKTLLSLPKRTINLNVISKLRHNQGVTNLKRRRIVSIHSSRHGDETNARYNRNIQCL